MAPRVLVETDLLDRLVCDSSASASEGSIDSPSLVSSEERAALHQLVLESRRLAAVWADRPP